MRDFSELLYDALPEGLDNAISLTDLATYFGIDERDLRSRILYARQHGYMICSLASEQKGYYKPSDIKEAVRCYRMFSKRLESTQSVVSGMRDYILKNGIDPDLSGEIAEGEPC